MIIRKHFYFSGRVQGVGFRYQACRIARNLGLTGYVKNLWDLSLIHILQNTDRKDTGPADPCEKQHGLRGLFLSECSETFYCVAVCYGCLLYTSRCV